MILIIIIGMLAAFWSGFWIGYVRREEKRPPMPFAQDIEEIVERVQDKLYNEKNTIVNFYE